MKLFCILFLCIVSASLVSSAHFIVGIATNAADGESADGKTVMLWNTAVGQSDNVTDIVGASGNSGAANTYLIDCELLTAPCAVGDDVRVQIIDSGDGYISNYTNVTITGAGFDIAPNITMNSLPIIQNISVDDLTFTPSGEIDLQAGTNVSVFCDGTLREYDGDNTVSLVRAEFFSTTHSFFGDVNDNNGHYTNESCILDTAYGDSEHAAFSCSVSVEYYAVSGGWNCTVESIDALNSSGVGSNSTFINSLLALSVPSPLDFGIVNSSEVTSEITLNISNAGNSVMNLSLSGYGRTPLDGLFMNCTIGNISVEHAKYNLTGSTAGQLTLGQTSGFYTNLSSNSVINEFNLAVRQNDTIGVFARNTTYWRAFIPATAQGSCSGSIVVGAIAAQAF